MENVDKTICLMAGYLRKLAKKHTREYGTFSATTDMYLEEIKRLLATLSLEELIRVSSEYTSLLSDVEELYEPSVDHMNRLIQENIDKIKQGNRRIPTEAPTVESLRRRYVLEGSNYYKSRGISDARFIILNYMDSAGKLKEHFSKPEEELFKSRIGLYLELLTPAELIALKAELEILITLYGDYEEEIAKQEIEMIDSKIKEKCDGLTPEETYHFKEQLREYLSYEETERANYQIIIEGSNDPEKVDSAQFNIQISDYLISAYKQVLNQYGNGSNQSSL